MVASDTGPQVPRSGPLSSIDEDTMWTGETQYLRYGGSRHLRKAFKIPTALLHFNIENGRYHTKFLLLRAANPSINIDAKEQHWHSEILKMLKGTWEDSTHGVTTRDDAGPFDGLVEDIKIREQERTAIVLESGGVMSGNRRLAALLTLSEQHPDSDTYKYLIAFIVPGEGAMTGEDRWRLEMSAQLGQGRLVRQYDPVERLLKMKEGVELIKTQDSTKGEERAIHLVASDFGTPVEIIKEDLESLKYIINYLESIGHPLEYWLANNLTEVFTQFEPLERALETNALPLPERAKLKRTLYGIILNGHSDYQLIRDVRTAVGPIRRRQGAHGVPEAVSVLLKSAPTGADLHNKPTPSSKAAAEDVVAQFKSEFQAGRAQETPMHKAQRAETNLRTVCEMLLDGANVGTPARAKRLRDSLEGSQSYAREALELTNPATRQRKPAAP